MFVVVGVGVGMNVCHTGMDIITAVYVSTKYRVVCLGNHSLPKTIVRSATPFDSCQHHLPNHTTTTLQYARTRASVCIFRLLQPPRGAFGCLLQTFGLRVPSLMGSINYCKYPRTNLHPVSTAIRQQARATHIQSCFI